MQGTALLSCVSVKTTGDEVQLWCHMCSDKQEDGEEN